MMTHAHEDGAASLAQLGEGAPAPKWLTTDSTGARAGIRLSCRRPKATSMSSLRPCPSRRVAAIGVGEDRMNWKLFAIGVAALVLAASGAQAKAHHYHRHHSVESARIGRMDYSEPSQPIAYALLDAYLRASPRERAARDWSGGMALASGTSATTTNNSSAVSSSGSPNGTTSAQSGAVNQAPATTSTEAASAATPPDGSTAATNSQSAAGNPAPADTPPTTSTQSAGADSASAKAAPSTNTDAPSTGNPQPPSAPTSAAVSSKTP
jgi:hypothetical protein